MASAFLHFFHFSRVSFPSFYSCNFICITSFPLFGFIKYVNLFQIMKWSMGWLYAEARFEGWWLTSPSVSQSAPSISFPINWSKSLMNKAFSIYAHVCKELNFIYFYNWTFSFILNGAQLFLFSSQSHEALISHLGFPHCCFTEQLPGLQLL